MKHKNQKGFTLAELLIVVAIIAVLVAISIPIFQTQLEKARKAVDLHMARNVSTILTNAFNAAEIQIPEGNDDSFSDLGAWVFISRDSSVRPQAYYTINRFQNNGTLFCGSDAGVVINGNSPTSWNIYNDDIETLLRKSGINLSKLRITSKDRSRATGWDWIIIEIGRLKEDHKFFSRIYSGFSGDRSGLRDCVNSNIEKMINGTN